ncbi:MAG: PSD1 domain-containing protein [Pirellulaceae bacterium]|jgi:hypothetical protein|nr:PSD1 domain-containing protein [Pirellulaceae bacterium]
MPRLIIGLSSWLAGLSLVILLSSYLRAAPPVDYVNDVQPILAEHCSHCHGADPDSRQSGLRLDVQEDALRGGDSGEPAIVPGDPSAGELLARILSDDADEIMPPTDQHNPLTPQQIELLKQWIAQGANYASHWAFVPPQKIQLDFSDNHPGAGLLPIDALVSAKLASAGMQPAPPAEPHVLCRRIHLDLIGLPPTLDELAAFEHDGVEATVKKLLASPRYGEKWGRHWLDAARYSDTNGYEKDLRRDQWIWRDWVIAALNRDMPYDQFIREQIAGDLMPDATQDQIIATGFLRNSMLNEEGAIVPEQFRMFEMFDRIDCIGKSVMGLTVQCAQCHSHKFDPVSHEEYYGIFAFLNDTYEAQSWVYNPEQQHQLEEVHAALAAIDRRVRQAHPDWQSELEDFTEQLAAQQSEWQPLQFHQLETQSGLNHPVQASDRSIQMLGHVSADVFFVATGAWQGVTGLRLEALPHRDFPFNGPGRSSVGGWDVLEWEVMLKRPGQAEWEKQALVNATADYSQPEQKLEDGKKSFGPVAYLIDGKDENAWKADRGMGRRNQASVAVVQFDKPLDCPAETEMKVVLRMKEMLGSCRISTTTAPNPTATPMGVSVDYAAVLAALTPAAERSEEQQSTLFAAWRKSLPELQALNDESETVWQRYPQAMTSVLHLAKRSEQQHRPTHMLLRGEWDQPQEATVEPHVPRAFHPLDPTLGNGRLAFAHWLVDQRSPLAARVAVNRVWQVMFGDGLVETSDDFGTRAPVPEQRELLDWLAVDFMEHGWSQKYLIEQIALSRTYQQQSQVASELREQDPNNRLLARGPRFRADAEVIRDIALSVSGLISHRLGGPGVIPPVPQNVLDYNYVYPEYWKPATGPERYRRAVYIFRKRSMPDPVMSSMDAPNGDQSCARRVLSNTPLAALAGLNEAVFVEAAQALALRILREEDGDDAARARLGFELCTSREPTEAETTEVLKLLTSQRERVAEGWLNPREIATGDPAKLPELPEGCTPQDAAVWTLVARVLLNLDETISKN